MQEPSRGKHIFTLKIIWDDKHDLIVVHENDEPSLISTEFVNRNSLPESYIELIESEIESKIEKLLQVEKIETEDLDEVKEDESNEPGVSKEEETGEDVETYDEGGLRINSKKSLTPERKRSGKKLAQYKKVFRFLTPIKFITVETMACIDIKHKVCKILMPLLIDLNSTDESIDFVTFCCKMDALSKVLSPSDQSYLMKFQTNLKEISPETKTIRYRRNLFTENISKRYL